MRKIQIPCIGIRIAFLAVAAVGSDVMVVKNVTHEGTFEGFEKNIFRFQTAEGEFLKEKRGKVSRLELAEPCKVTLLRTGKKESEPGLFKKYERLKFIFDENGKDKAEFANSIKKITVLRDPEPAVNGRGGGGGNGSVEFIDVGPLEEREGLSAAQSAALQQYKAASAKYRAFVDTSTALVGQMDGAAGGERDRLLNQLRLRKNEEQPLKSAFNTATAQLLAKFPELVADQN